MMTQLRIPLFSHGSWSRLCLVHAYIVYLYGMQRLDPVDEDLRSLVCNLVAKLANLPWERGEVEAAAQFLENGSCLQPLFAFGLDTP